MVSTHPTSELGKLVDAEQIEFEKNDKTYTLRPLTMRQWGEIELWGKRQPLESAKVQMEYAPSPEERDRIWKEALKESNGMNMASESFRLVMLSFQGLCELFYLSLRRAHPTLSREEASDLLDAEMMEHFQLDFMTLNKAIFGPVGSNDQSVQETPQGNVPLDPSRLTGKPSSAS